MVVEQSIVMVADEPWDFTIATTPILSLLVPELRKTKRLLVSLAQSVALHMTSFILVVAVADWETNNAFYL